MSGITDQVLAFSQSQMDAEIHSRQVCLSHALEICLVLGRELHSLPKSSQLIGAACLRSKADELLRHHDTIGALMIATVASSLEKTAALPSDDNNLPH